MARIVNFGRPKVHAIDTISNDGFCITYTQKIYFKLDKPVPEGAVYDNKETLQKEKMNPINTDEYFEAEKLLIENKLVRVIALPKEEELR